MKKKVYSRLDEVVADVPDGARIMFGGFGGAGFPNNLIQALVRKGVKNITAISNNCGTHDGELGLMFKNNQIKHVIASFPGPHASHFQERFAAKEVTLELVPQGILCERMRAAGAHAFAKNPLRHQFECYLLGGEALLKMTGVGTREGRNHVLDLVVLEHQAKLAVVCAAIIADGGGVFYAFAHPGLYLIVRGTLAGGSAK